MPWVPSFSLTEKLQHSFSPFLIFLDLGRRINSHGFGRRQILFLRLITWGWGRAKWCPSPPGMEQLLLGLTLLGLSKETETETKNIVSVGCVNMHQYSKLQSRQNSCVKYQKVLTVFAGAVDAQFSQRMCLVVGVDCLSGCVTLAVQRLLLELWSSGGSFPPQGHSLPALPAPGMGPPALGSPDPPHVMRL